jgi:2-aminoadipate transaminase
MSTADTSNWTRAFSQRALNQGAAELATILAGSPPGVLSVSGGFPSPATFPTEVLDEIVAGLLRDDPGVALQYAPSEGIPSVREYLIDRQEMLQGRRAEKDELIVTSGGMECITLAGLALLDPGDAVVVEAPTYLGALMAFAGFEAPVTGIPMDEHGLQVDVLEARLADGLRPKLIYLIPDFQNPTGRTLTLERREALIELCRRHGVLILEDVAYREMSFDGGALPSLWSLGPDVVVQAGTFSKIFCPGVRLGWAVGPADVVAQMAAAKQTGDQCAGALAQRIVEQ